MDIKEKLIKLFSNLGIYVDDNNYDELLDLDSLQFASIIVSIEREFLIRLDDSLLVDGEQLLSFQDFLNLIEQHFT